MQNTLTFEHEGRKYVSKPFDFETLCLVNDKHDGENGVAHMGANAVDYMFRDTGATEDIIHALPMKERMRLCREVWEMYVEALKND